jgi:hypothetical protein
MSQGGGEDPEDDAPGLDWPSESEYLEALAHERHMFAWVLVEHGGRTLAEAEREALERYAYEPPESRYRGLIFHDRAWHWAMLRIHGQGYWWGHPEREPEPEAYGEESRRFEASRG